MKLLEKAWEVQVNILVHNRCCTSHVREFRKSKKQLEDLDNRGHVKNKVKVVNVHIVLAPHSDVGLPH